MSPVLVTFFGGPRDMERHIYSDRPSGDVLFVNELVPIASFSAEGSQRTIAAPTKHRYDLRRVHMYGDTRDHFLAIYGGSER